MDKDTMKLLLNQLSHLLFLPQEELEQLLAEYEIKEIRQRSFYWIAFFFVHLRCLINGKSRHKDCLYKELFKISLSENTFSDRLSQLPIGFCVALLKRVQVHLNKIGSPKSYEYGK